MPRRFALVVAATVAALALASPAAAHIDPDPKQAQAGSRRTVGFTVEHGCEGSPTVQLDMRLPAGVTDPTPEPLDGWESAVEGDVITYVGGPLPDDVEATFDITMTLPTAPDTTIYFPFVQRCEVGEIRWIGIPTEPDDELDEPAPAMNLIGPVATTTPTTATEAPATTAPGGAPTTAAPATTVAPMTATAAPTTDSAATSVETSGESDASSNTGTIMFIVSIAAVALVAGLAYLRSRSGSEPDDAT